MKKTKTVEYRKNTKYKKLFSFGRKSFFGGGIRVNLFISSLGLKSPLRKLNQQSSCFMILFCSMLNQQSSLGKRGYLKFYAWSASVTKIKIFLEKCKKFSYGNFLLFFGFGSGKCARVFFRESIRNFLK